MITIIIAIFIVAVSCVIFWWIWNTFRVYNKKIIVFENIAGQGFQPVFKDRARFVKVGDGGEELMLLLKKKVFRTAYGKKMGKNTYWFAIGQDGYWYNIVLGDLDAKMGMLDIEPVDRDLRGFHVSSRRNTQQRYRKVKFMEKYGSVMINGMFLIIMLIGVWFLADKMGEIAGLLIDAIDGAIKVQEASGDIISGLDNIVGSQSGIERVV
jgi:hypothetical protein